MATHPQACCCLNAVAGGEGWFPFRYQELAELAMRWLQSHAAAAGDAAGERPGAREAAGGSPLLVQMAHEVYRVVLFGVFYLQVSLLGYLPYIGEQHSAGLLPEPLLPPPGAVL